MRTRNPNGNWLILPVIDNSALIEIDTSASAPDYQLAVLVYSVEPPLSVNPAPVVVPPCEGEDCQGPPQAQPGNAETATGSFSGPGNVTPAKPKPCRKGFVKRHGKCVRKQKKHKRHGKHRSKSRGANGQGGGR